MEKEHNTAIFWDYDMENIDLTDPKVKAWFLTRKLQFGDLSGISTRELKEHLPALNIQPSLKKLLQNYLDTCAK